jgi:hypothetical protein
VTCDSSWGDPVNIDTDFEDAVEALLGVDDEDDESDGDEA